MTKWWIAGSRPKWYSKIISNKDLRVLVYNELEIALTDGDEVKTGGAFGVDMIAENSVQFLNTTGSVRPVSKSTETQVTLYPAIRPNWKLGRGAGLIRNKEGVDWADKVIVFWEGSSPGTENVIDHAKKQNKLHKVVMMT